MWCNNISYVKLHELLDCLIKNIFKVFWDIWWIKSVMREEPCCMLSIYFHIQLCWMIVESLLLLFVPINWRLCKGTILCKGMAIFYQSMYCGIICHKLWIMVAIYYFRTWICRLYFQVAKNNIFCYHFSFNNKYFTIIEHIRLKIFVVYVIIQNQEC